MVLKHAAKNVQTVVMNLWCTKKDALFVSIVVHHAVDNLSENLIRKVSRSKFFAPAYFLKKEIYFQRMI